jgi:hypothetical protein
VRIHDFDFLVGSWSVHHRRRRAPLSGRDEWYEFVGEASAQILFRGAVSIDEIALANSETGLSLRLRNPGTDTWTIYWVNSRDGQLQAPITGSWNNNVFEGHGDEQFAGHAITARYRWSSITPGTAHWEQAFSVDDGLTWETNWVMDWTRGVNAAHGRGARG